MAQVIQVGVIGVGRIGKMHIDILKRHCLDVRIKAIVDPCAEALRPLYPDVSTVSSDIQTILNDNDIKAVLIATPTTSHIDLIKQCAHAHKHIFCEKPVGLDANQIQALRNEIKDTGVFIQIGYNRRFDKEFMAIRQKIQNGEVGDLYMIKIVNRDPKRPDLAFIPNSGGLFLDFSVHDFDMVRYLSGREVKEIFAYGSCLVDPKIETFNDIDTAIISLKLDNDVLCVIDNSRETLYGYDQQVEVFGSNGSFRAKNCTPTQVTFLSENGIVKDRPHYSFVERYHEAYIQELITFFNSCRTQTPPSVGLEDTQKAVQIAQAALQSLKLRSSVYM